MSGCGLMQGLVAAQKRKFSLEEVLGDKDDLQGQELFKQNFVLVNAHLKKNKVNEKNRLAYWNKKNRRAASYHARRGYGFEGKGANKQTTVSFNPKLSKETKKELRSYRKKLKALRETLEVEK